MFNKKTLVLLSCLLLAISNAGCTIFGTDNPEIKLKVERTGKANEIAAMGIQSLSVRAPADANQYLISPNNVKIAFTKVWFPNQTGYDLLCSTTTKKSDFRLIKDAEIYRDYCIIAVDKPESDPEIFDLDEDGFGVETSVIPPEDTYYGVIVELFYYEFEIENFGSIRWYEPDYEGAWQTKKIMIKLTDSSEWKYAYRQYGSGIVLKTEAQQLDRSKVDKDTAGILRERMKCCKSLFYITSDNSTASKWMPWELGYFDGIKHRVAILKMVVTFTENLTKLQKKS